MSADFHDLAKIHADLAKVNKTVRLAANVETATEVTASHDIPEKILPQLSQPT